MCARRAGWHHAARVRAGCARAGLGLHATRQRRPSAAARAAVASIAAAVGGAAEADAMRVGLAMHRKAQGWVCELTQAAVEVAATDHERFGVARAAWLAGVRDAVFVQTV